MTTIAAHLSVDSRGPCAIYIASDSRITWGAALRRWDAGQKTFASSSSPDIFGYCGSAFFPTQIIVIDLREAVVIGREFWFNSIEREARRKIGKVGYFSKLAAIDHAPRSIDHEHRAKFDGERWKSEIEAYREKQDSILREREQRERQRLKKLTIPVLREETQFEDWDTRTQIVPPEFALGVRKRSKELLNDLEALGAKPRRKDVRGLLKAYISWLNTFDGSFGYAIETEEREDLMVFVEELCWATKQKPLISETDTWRDW